MPGRGEFRATTDQMLQIIEDLRAVERKKQRVPIGDLEFLLLAKRAEELSRLTFRWAEIQLSMALDARERIANGNLPGDVRLLDVEPRPLDRILANWREAQIRLEIAGLGSPEAEAATRDVERLREEYQAIHQAMAGGDLSRP
jgi:hypothetical protein